MASSLPVFSSVSYTDPKRPPLPGTAQLGLVANVTGQPTPSNWVLAACLLQNGVPLMYGLGANSFTIALALTASLSPGLPYILQVQWADPATPDPSKLNWNNPQVVASAPVCTARLGVTGGQVDLGAKTVTIFGQTESAGSPQGAYACVCDGNGNQVAYSVVAAGATCVVTSFTPQAGQAYWVYLMGAQPISGSAFAAPFSAGPPSEAFLLPCAAPALGSLSFDGQRLDARWAVLSLPAFAAGASYWLNLLSSSGQVVASYPAGPQGGTVVASLGAGMSVAASIGYGPVQGPLGAGVTTPVGAPSLAGLQYASGAVTGKAQYSFPSGVGSPAVQVSLYSGQTLIAGPVAAASDGTFSLPAGANVAGLSVRAGAGGVSSSAAVSGPLSAPASVVTTGPVLTAALLEYAMVSPGSPQWQISAEWVQAEPEIVTGYTATLQQGSQTLGTWNLSTNRLPPSPLSSAPSAAGPALQLVVQALGRFCEGAPGDPATFACSAPSLTVLCAGGGVQASWQMPSGAGSGAVGRLRLVRTADRAAQAAWSTVAQGDWSSSSQGSLSLAQLPLPALGGGGYGLTVDTAVGNAVTRANAVSDVVLQAPALASLRGIAPNGDAGQAVVSWSLPPAGATAPDSFWVVLQSDSQLERKLASVSGSTWSTTAPLGQTPPPDARVAVRAVVGNCIGPASPALPLLLAAPPGLVGAAALPGGVQVDFLPMAFPSPAYVLSLLANGTSIATADASGSSGFIPWPGPPAAGTTYSVGVAAASADGRSTGPGATALPVVLLPPTLSAPAASNGVLTVGVTAPASGSAAATGYSVEVLKNGLPVQRASLPAPSGASLSVPLTETPDPAGSYSVRARAQAGTATGPAAEIPVIVAAPVTTSAVTAIVSGAATVTVAVNPGVLPGASLALEAVLIADGTPGTPVPVASGQAALPVPSGAKVCAVSARAKTASATGPWSGPVPVPIAPPVASATADAVGIDLTWSGDSGAFYSVALTAGATTLSQTVARGLSVRRPLPPGSPAGLQAQVTQLAGVAVGPAGALALVGSGCAISSLSLDGQGSLTLDWQDPPGVSGVTAYRPVIQWTGGRRVLDPLPAGSTHAVIPLPSGIPAAATLAIQAVAGAATGPLGPAVPILTQAPSGLALSYDGATITARWRPSPDERVTGYAAVLTVGGQASPPVAAAGTSCQIAYAPPAQPPDPAVTVAVSAVSGAATGPAGTAVGAILRAPAFASASCDGTSLQAAWSSVPEPGSGAGYLLSAARAGSVVALSTVSGTSASIALPPGVGPLALSVSGWTEDSGGPASAALAVIDLGPAVQQAVVDPVSGKATVGWAASATPGATYLVQRFLAGAPLGAPLPAATNSLLLPDAPGAFADLAVSVAATVAAGGATVTGPYGAPFPLATAQPAIARADFDGISASIEWSPVPGATGYAISILGSGGGAPAAQASASASAHSLRLAFTPPDPSQAYSAVVQAASGASVGVCSPAAPLFETGFYLGATGGTPRLFRADSLAVAPAALTAYLPEIGPLTGLPIAPPPPGTPTPPAPFTIAANTDAATKAAFPYTLALANSALQFPDASPIRADLASTYGALLAAAETAGATPWGLLVLQQTIARLMPQTFAETLLYSYGLDPSGQQADLRPGTILRVAFGEYDLMPGSSPPQWSGGYAGGAVADYEIGDYLDGSSNAWRLGFDSFLAWLTSNGVVTVPQPATDPQPPPGPAFTQSGGAEAADLFFPKFRQPFYRLFFPGSLQAAGSPTTPLTAQQFTLAAAGTYAAISTASTAPSTAVAVAYFRGRAVLKLCIRVVVDGSEQVVPVGTTLGNLLDRLGRRPPSTAVALGNLRLERALGPVVLDPTAPYDAAAGYRVRVDWNKLATFGPPRDALSLPLLHGDRLTLRGPTAA